jgi:hypothetical protein
MADTFDVTRPETWPPTLTLTQVAAIYQRKPGGVRWSVCHRQFVPAPMVNPLKRDTYLKPMRWRTADVRRALDVAPSTLRRAG